MKVYAAPRATREEVESIHAQHRLAAAPAFDLAADLLDLAAADITVLADKLPDEAAR
jgi:hypothetical protein